MSKKEVKGITIRLDKDLHTEFKLLCMKEGKDITKVVKGLIQFYLDNNKRLEDERR